MAAKTLLAHILDDLKDREHWKEIRPFDLRYLGYVLTGAKAKIRSCPYELREVEELEVGKCKRSVSFCYLLDTQKNIGFIIPYPFSRYCKLKDTCKTKHTK